MSSRLIQIGGVFGKLARNVEGKLADLHKRPDESGKVVAWKDATPDTDWVTPYRKSHPDWSAAHPSGLGGSSIPKLPCPKTSDDTTADIPDTTDVLPYADGNSDSTAPLQSLPGAGAPDTSAPVETGSTIQPVNNTTNLMPVKMIIIAVVIFMVVKYRSVIL